MSGCQGTISRQNADGYQVHIINHGFLYNTAPGLSFRHMKCQHQQLVPWVLCAKKRLLLWQQVCLCACAVLWHARLPWTVLFQRWRLRGRPTCRRRGTSTSSSRPRLKLQTRSLPSGDHCLQKDKIRKDYAFEHRFDEKPSVIPGCPGIIAFIPGGNACTNLRDSCMWYMGMGVWMRICMWINLGPKVWSEAWKLGTCSRFSLLVSQVVIVSSFVCLCNTCVCLEGRHDFFLSKIWLLDSLGKLHTDRSCTLDMFQNAFFHTFKRNSHSTTSYSKEVVGIVAL